MQLRARLEGVVFTVAMAVAALGCEMPPPAAPPPPIQKEALVEAPIGQVWDAAVEWFASRGMPIKNIDRTSGLLTTEHAMGMDAAGALMNCGAPGPTANGKIEHLGHSGHFNVLLRAQGDRQTKVSVNAFFGCMVNTYENVGLLVTEQKLVSTTRKECASTGELERSILSHLAKVKAAPAEAPVASPDAPAPAPVPEAAPVPPAPAPAACTADTDCRGGRVCRAGSCTTPSCAKDVDCPEPQICESGVCQAPKP